MHPARFGAESLIEANTTLQGKPKHSTSKPAKSILAKAGNAKRLQLIIHVIMYFMYLCQWIHQHFTQLACVLPSSNCTALLASSSPCKNEETTATPPNNCILTAQSLMNGVAIRSLLGRRSPETGTASCAQRMRLEAEQTSRQRVVPGVVGVARKIGNLPEGPRHAEKAKVTCVDHNLLGMTKPTHNPGCELLEQGSLSLYYIYIYIYLESAGPLACCLLMFGSPISKTHFA